jgi:site-specific recombinase XerD
LALQANLGRAANTVEAYGRALEDFLGFSARRDVDGSGCRSTWRCTSRDLDPAEPARRQRAGADSGVGLANATLQQRLTAVRLYYDYLVEEGIRRATRRAGPLHGGSSRGRCQ